MKTKAPIDHSELLVMYVVYCTTAEYNTTSSLALNWSPSLQSQCWFEMIKLFFQSTILQSSIDPFSCLPNSFQILRFKVGSVSKIKWQTDFTIATEFLYDVTPKTSWKN